MPEQKLTLSEVAKELDVPASTIIGMAKRGEVKQWKREDGPGELYSLSQTQVAVERDGPAVVRYRNAVGYWLWVDGLPDSIKRAIVDWKHEGYCGPLQRPVVIVGRNEPTREPGDALVIERNRFKGSGRPRDFISTADLRTIKQVRAGELVIPDPRLRLPELVAKFGLAKQTIITWANTNCPPLKRPLRTWPAPDHAGHKLYWPADVEEALRDGTLEENGESFTDAMGEWKWLAVLPVALRRSIEDWKKNGHCPPTAWGVQIVTRREVGAMTKAPPKSLLIQRRWLRGTTKPRDFVRQQDLNAIAAKKTPISAEAVRRPVDGKKTDRAWLTSRQAKRIGFGGYFLRTFAENPDHPRGAKATKSRKPEPHPLLKDSANPIGRPVRVEWRFFSKSGNGTWRLVYSGDDLRKIHSHAGAPDKEAWASARESFEYLPMKHRGNGFPRAADNSHWTALLLQWHRCGCTYLDGENLEAKRAWLWVKTGRRKRNGEWSKRLAAVWYFSREHLRSIQRRMLKTDLPAELESGTEALELPTVQGPKVRLVIGSEDDYPLIDGKPASRKLTPSEHDAITAVLKLHDQGIARPLSEDIEDINNPSRRRILGRLAKDHEFQRFISTPGGKSRKGKGFAILNAQVLI